MRTNVSWLIGIAIARSRAQCLVAGAALIHKGQGHACTVASCTAFATAPTALQHPWPAAPAGKRHEQRQQVADRVDGHTPLAAAHALPLVRCRVLHFAGPTAGWGCLARLSVAVALHAGRKPPARAAAAPRARRDRNRPGTAGHRDGPAALRPASRHLGHDLARRAGLWPAPGTLPRPGQGWPASRGYSHQPRPPRSLVRRTPARISRFAAFAA